MNLIASNQMTLTNLLERAEIRRETFYKLTNSADVPTAPSGNRNLILYSADPWQAPQTGYYQYFNAAKTSENYNGAVVYKTWGAWGRLGINLNNHLVERGLLKVGDVLTYSVLAKTDQKTPIQSRLFVRYDNQSEPENINGKNETINLTTEWQKVSVTFTVTEKMLSENNRVNYLGWEQTTNSESGKFVYYTCNKIERGNNSTPYSQAPEDLGWSVTTLVPTQQQRYLWKFEYVYYSDGSVEVTQPVNLSISGMDGIAGKDGVGLKSTVVTYGLSTSETTQPTSWTAQVPTLTKGKYLWTKTVWTYTDNTTETGYQKTYIAKDGNDGADGIPGKDGVGIKTTTITYAASTSGTTKPASGWSSTIPNVPAGQYLWTKTVWTYTDGTNETGYSVAKMGERGPQGPQGPQGERGPQGIQGLQGPKGDQGIQGEKGADGRTQYTHIAYADNATGGGFSQTDQTKPYIGMYVDFTATDSSDPTKYKWSKWHGEDGAQGIPGKPGADGKTPYIHFAYADDDKGTNFSLTDNNQQYQGYYSDYTEADSTDYRKYKWVDRLANVEVSGINLLKNTKAFKGSNITGSSTLLSDTYQGCAVRYLKTNNATSGSQEIAQFNNCVYPNRGGDYVASFWAKGVGQLSIYFYGPEGYLQAASTVSSWGETTTRPDGYVPLTLTNEWQRYWIKYKLKTEPTSATSVGKHLLFRHISNGNVEEIWLAGCKLEEATIPTPYSEAPEDIQDYIDDKADETITQDQLNALKEQAELQQKELEAKADLDTIEKWYKEYLDYVNINNENKEKSEAALIAISERVAAITNDLGETKERWNFINTYMDVADEGLVIGKQDGSANIKISNDRISMFSNGDEVMWISQNTLHIANGVFVQTLQIGNFRFESLDSNGEILGLRYLGG